MKLAAAVALAFLCATPTAAQDFGSEAFTGLYAGLYGGIVPENNQMGHAGGVVVGGRTSIANNFVLGLELQAGPALLGGTFFPEFYALGQFGVVVQNNVFLFAEAGAAARIQPDYFAGDGKYVVAGVGAEVALNEIIHMRVSAEYVHNLDSPSGYSTGRGNIGFFAQMN